MLNKANLEEIFFFAGKYVEDKDEAIKFSKEIGVYVMELWRKNREAELILNKSHIDKAKEKIRSSTGLHEEVYWEGMEKAISVKIVSNQTEITQANEFIIEILK